MLLFARVYSIYKAIRENEKVIDVDGSYLYNKSKQLEESGITVAFDIPSAPISGWEAITEANAKDMATRLPIVTSGTVYVYLPSQTGRDTGEGTFRALTRGYNHWASGRIDSLEVNTHHPMYCHVQSVMKPSMKPGSYHVWLLLGCDGPFASIQAATCECAAG